MAEGGWLPAQILPMIIFEYSFREAELQQFGISYFVG